ncbi:MAG TPA: hypothetical protein VF933_31185 [Streptosporangiaceae bacterium]
MADYEVSVRRRRTWGLVLLGLVLLIAVLVFANKPAPAATNGGSISLSLKAVPTIRSVTVSPSTATFGNCTGGSTSADTASTSGALGYPNGHCWEGAPGANRSFPIKITYQGPPGRVFVAGANASPSGGGPNWALCNPSAACTGPGGAPGADQYMVKNFGTDTNNSTGLTGSLTCDQEFSSRGCSATQGQSEKEGIELIGPQSSGSTSSSWTVTVTWAAAPP